MSSAELPQLPAMIDVTPILTKFSARGCSVMSSACVWTSMNPGATTSPVASIASRPSCLEKVPTAATLPSLIPTSARRAAAPVPSTTRPPTTTRSNRGGVCGCAVIQAAKRTAAVPRLASMGRILSRGEGWSRRGRRGRRTRNRLNSETQRHGGGIRVHGDEPGRRIPPADDGPSHRATRHAAARSVAT